MAARSPLTLDLARGADWQSLYENELDALDRLKMFRLLTESALWGMIGFAGFVLLLVLTASVFLPAGVAAAWAATGLPVLLAPVLVLLAGAVLLVMATLLLSRADSLRRRMTEQEGRIAFCEIARGFGKPYALCLKPQDELAIRPNFPVRLARTARLLAAAPRLMWTDGGQAELKSRQAQLFVDRSRPGNLDAAIRNDLLPVMPVLMLGFSDGGTADLSGKLSPEDEAWNETVSLLLAGAERIFCQPDLSGGPVWELGRLKPLGLVRRTVFVMPPAGLMPGHPDLAPRIWERAAAKAEAAGLGFPAWSPEGAFFCAGEPGQPPAREAFTLGGAGFFRTLHLRLAEHMAPPAATLPAAPKAAPAVSRPLPDHRSSQLRQASPQ